MKRDDPQAGLEGLVKAAVTIFGENKVAAERPRGQRRRLTDQAPTSADHVSVTMPSAPAFETAAASPGNLGHGRLDDRLLNPEHLA